MGVITKTGYAGYFLITADFIKAARDLGIPVGPGRGSAAGSAAHPATKSNAPEADPFPTLVDNALARALDSLHSARRLSTGGLFGLPGLAGGLL